MANDEDKKPAETPVSTPVSTHGVSIKTLAFAILINLATTAGSIYVYDQYYAPKVIGFDIRGYVDQLREEWTTGKIDMVQAGNKIDALGKKLKEFKGNNVILSTEVILNSSAPVIKIDASK